MDAELKKPDFWAVHYFLLLGNEETEDSEVVEPIFGIAAEELYKYYEGLVVPADSARLLSVDLDNKFGVGVRYVDQGDAGHAIEFYLTHTSWAQPELLGYDSPHFALPVFRWKEVKKIHASVADQSKAAVAALLAFRGAYLTADDSEGEVLTDLSKWWKEIPFVRPKDIRKLVHNTAANCTNAEIRWWRDPELGWINDGSYSFRNPKTRMCAFSRERFQRIRDFLAALGSEDA